MSGMGYLLWWQTCAGRNTTVLPPIMKGLEGKEGGLLPLQHSFIAFQVLLQPHYLTPHNCSTLPHHYEAQPCSHSVSPAPYSPVSSTLTKQVQPNTLVSDTTWLSAMSLRDVYSEATPNMPMHSSWTPSTVAKFVNTSQLFKTGKLICMHHTTFVYH